MELWGGIECTLNRVGGRRFDQLERCGHYDRAGDLERIAALGIRTLRYPLLWERAAPSSSGVYDWRFADERLACLKALGVTPIAGLVHHGSGPDHAEIASPAFAPGLADYAGAVARRFPWLQSYTPINEPLTTARFCGLYGHWHPHGRSEWTFARILFNQCHATILAMRAIREVNSAAKLVQTEDLGTIYSTPHLEHQARFENERRWLTWDLLCGNVNRTHPMYPHLRAWGLSADELAWLEENPCPPDVIGIDHYVTSDRFLDEDVSRYPAHNCGGNGRQVYADVEAVRVLEQPGTSLRILLRRAARRYGLPIALTEVHIGCAQEEQVRWLNEAWTTCERVLAKTEADVIAVTAWSLLGSYDWDSLLTADRGHYEAGAFSVRDGTLRPRALVNYLASRADSRGFGLPVGQGWWRNPDRLTWPRSRYSAATSAFPLTAA